ncbi:MAG TPA: preprotein translocase subunit Sec61beta [Candidatus Norongarragalinales archaeon]|nr:preprotein translocase subunit Sec61beta [Candidatus Norongarragalinales archaeon]
MGEDKIQSPSSSTGIMRFYDVSSSKVQLDAKIVIGFTVAVILLEIVLQMF